MKKAGFLKRMFAFIVDLTVIILATILLYLFPFSMIINKSIDTDYKANVGDVVDQVNTKYSGSSSIFGASTDGLISVLEKYYSGKAECDETIINEYVQNHTNMLNKTNLVLSSMIQEQYDVYDASESEEDRFYSKVYGVYGYILYAYNCLYSFKMNDSYEIYSDIKTRDDLSSSQVTELENAYNASLQADFGKALNTLIKVLVSYAKENPELDTTKLVSYRTIAQQARSILGSSYSEVGDATQEDIDYISAFINKYDAFFNYAKDNALDGTKLNQKAYYCFYYDLLIMQFDELLPVHNKYSTHSTVVVLYALVAFTVLYTVYTMLLKGRTLGRRVDKIKLVDKDGSDNLNVVQVFLHDILFGFGYLILIGCFDIRIMLIVALVFVIADAIMIKVIKKGKTIRSYISQTVVVEE